jgi:hypothetical protein
MLCITLSVIVLGHRPSGVLFFRRIHLTNLMSHRDFLSAVKVGTTNVRDNAILPPTESADCVGVDLLTPTSFSPFFPLLVCPGESTLKSRLGRVGTSKIILDFYPFICLVQWIIGVSLDYHYQWYLQNPAKGLILITQSTYGTYQGW